MKSLYQIIIIYTFINAYQSRIFINHKFFKFNITKWANFTIIPRELNFHEIQHILTNY